MRWHLLSRRGSRPGAAVVYGKQARFFARAELNSPTFPTASHRSCQLILVTLSEQQKAQRFDLRVAVIQPNVSQPRQLPLRGFQVLQPLPFTIFVAKIGAQPAGSKVSVIATPPGTARRPQKDTASMELRKLYFRQCTAQESAPEISCGFDRIRTPKIGRARLGFLQQFFKMERVCREWRNADFNKRDALWQLFRHGKEHINSLETVHGAFGSIGFIHTAGREPAVLETAEFLSHKAPVCLKWQFQMRGAGRHHLSLEKTDAVNNERTTLWQRDGKQGDLWRRAVFTLAPGQRYKLAFNGTNAAIDEIKVKSGPCRPLDWRCDFEGPSCLFLVGARGWQRFLAADSPRGAPKTDATTGGRHGMFLMSTTAGEKRLWLRTSDRKMRTRVCVRAKVFSSSNRGEMIAENAGKVLMRRRMTKTFGWRPIEMELPPGEKHRVLLVTRLDVCKRGRWVLLHCCVAVKTFSVISPQPTLATRASFSSSKDLDPATRLPLTTLTCIQGHATCTHKNAPTTTM